MSKFKNVYKLFCDKYILILNIVLIIIGNIIILFSTYKINNKIHGKYDPIYELIYYF